MNRRPPADVVDLPRARRALDALDALAREHPELVDLEARGEANRAGWLATLTDLEVNVPTEGIPVRVPVELLERCAALVASVGEVPELRAAAGRMNRAAVLRLALLRGLDALEAEHGGTAKGGRHEHP